MINNFSPFQDEIEDQKEKLEKRSADIDNLKASLNNKDNVIGVS